MSFDGIVTGDTEIVAKFRAAGPKLRDEMRGAIYQTTVTVKKKAVLEKLRGQVLGVRTGRGYKSLAEVIFDEGDKTIGIVSTPVFYMIGWETGWAGYTPRRAANFDVSASGENFKNGTPRKRAFLVPSLYEVVQSGFLYRKIKEAMDRALA